MYDGHSVTIEIYVQSHKEQAIQYILAPMDFGAEMGHNRGAFSFELPYQKRVENLLAATTSSRSHHNAKFHDEQSS